MNRSRSRLLPALVAGSGIAISCAHAPPRELPSPRTAGSPQVEAGQRVRVTAFRWNWSRHVGTITALSADSITLMVTPARQAVALPLDAVNTLEVSRGHREARILPGLLKGAWIGAAAGFLLALPGSVDCSGMLCGVGLIVLPPMGAIVGAAYGGVHGAFSHPEVWERVPLDSLRRLRIGIVPQPEDSGRVGKWESGRAVTLLLSYSPTLLLSHSPTRS